MEIVKGREKTKIKSEKCSIQSAGLHGSKTETGFLKILCNVNKNHRNLVETNEKHPMGNRAKLAKTDEKDAL